MVPGYGEGGRRLAQGQSLLHPGGGVVHFLPTVQPPLKSGSIFANVVQQPGQACLFLRVEGTGELRGQVGSAQQMLLHRLFACPIGRDVSQKDRFIMRGSHHNVIPPDLL